MEHEHADDLSANSLVSNFLDRERDERGVFAPLLIMEGAKRVFNRLRPKDAQGVAWRTVVVGGAAVGLAFSGLNWFRGLNDLSAEADMQGADLSSDTKLISFDETVDIRTSVITYEGEAGGKVTVKVDGPGPDGLWPDYDTDYNFKGLGEAETLYPWEQLQQKNNRNGDVVVTFDPKKVIVNTYWKQRDTSQSDDAERKLYGSLDGLGDVAGLIPGLDGSDLDEMIHNLDGEVNSALDGKALESFGDECGPILDPLVKQSMQDAVGTIAASQGIDSDSIIYKWKDGKIDYSPEKDVTEWNEDAIDLKSFDFDKASCDSAELEVGSR